jgi:hypothetical protein
MRISTLSLLLAVALAGAARAQTAPVANAGADVTVACAGQEGTPINLNGMGSSLGSEFSYAWSAPGVTFNDPTSLTPIGTFPVGTTEVTLVVTSTDPNTAATATASDTAEVTVTDTTPPMVLATADPAALWPPNHKLRDVHVDLVSFDACDASPAAELVSITSNETDDGHGNGNGNGHGNPHASSDVAGADFGTPDQDFQLLAEREGSGNGRVYTILYRVTDLAGNTADSVTTVTVPHDQGHGSKISSGDAKHETLKQIAAAKKQSLKAAKAQLKAAKKLAKQQEKAYKAALKAAGD